MAPAIPKMIKSGEIKRTFGLFDCPALDRMGIDHGRPHVAVPQKLLNRPDIVVGLQ